MAEHGKKREGGLAVLKVMEEQGGSLHPGKGDANQVSLFNKLSKCHCDPTLSSQQENQR